MSYEMTGSRVRGKRASMYSMTTAGEGGRSAPLHSRKIPVPDFPSRPILSLHAFLPEAGPRIPSVLDAGVSVHVTAGRFAIALALKAMGIGEGEKILVPAYHCMTMVDPLAYTGSIPVFYRIREDLSPDLDDIATRIDPDTRVLMVTHYFGFPQDMPNIRKFCDAHGLRLLEDCAHAYFGKIGHLPLGSFGDYAIASPKKFFPIYDGGCLIFKDGATEPLPLRAQRMSASATAAIDQIGKALYYGNLPLLRPLAAVAKMIRHPVRERARQYSDGGDDFASTEAAHPGQMDSGGGGEFPAEWVDVAMSGYSDWIYRHVSRSRITTSRRRNYALLIDEIGDLANCRPIQPRLSDNVVPYEVPFWVDDLDRVFSILEDMAVPMHRFGQFPHPEMKEAVCRTAQALSRHLVQFPCHQDLSATDIRRIAARIRMALGK